MTSEESCNQLGSSDAISVFGKAANRSVTVTENGYGTITIALNGEGDKKPVHLTAGKDGVSGTGINFHPDPELAARIQAAAAAARRCGNFDPAARLVNEIARPAAPSVERAR